jgi:hypothetical protein
MNHFLVHRRFCVDTPENLALLLHSASLTDPSQEDREVFRESGCGLIHHDHTLYIHVFCCIELPENG